MEKNWETVLYKKIGNVATITMNRPEVRNAQNRQMTSDLTEAFSEGTDDDDVKVIILAGSGPHFSTGHDLGSPQRLLEDEKNPRPTGIKGRMKWGQELYLERCLRWRDIPKPTIAQVQGVCAAGAWMLVAICDLIIASEDARFFQPSLRMGGIGTEYFTEPWDLGVRKAKEILFTGEFMDAQDAWRVGFVNRVVPREKLEEETLKLAQKIALMPSSSLQFAKMSMNETQDIMGFRSSMINAYKNHMLAHEHIAEIQGGQGLLNRKASGQGVREFLRQRDKPFEG